MKRFIALLCAASAAVTVTSSASALVLAQSYSYTFTGVCAVGDCTGVGTGILTLTDSSTTFNTGNFKSFTYSSNLVNFSITNPFVTTRGSLTNIPGMNTTFIQDSSYFFSSDASGGWRVGPTVFVPADPDPSFDLDYDNGPTHLWNAGIVPEPATWAMMVGGFGLVGAGMRRRRTAVTFA